MACPVSARRKTCSGESRLTKSFWLILGPVPASLLPLVRLVQKVNSNWHTLGYLHIHPGTGLASGIWERNGKAAIVPFLCLLGHLKRQATCSWWPVANHYSDRQGPWARRTAGGPSRGRSCAGAGAEPWLGGTTSLRASVLSPLKGLSLDFFFLTTSSFKEQLILKTWG